jgi:hypothetical protein
MICPKCQRDMTFSDKESTPMRDVYRCWECVPVVRVSERSALSWVLLGFRILLFVTTAIPPDPTDFLL